MTGDCCAFKFLQRGVDGKHFMRFQSETTVFKFQRRSLGGPYTLWKNLAMSLIEYFSPRTACSLGTQIIKVHRRALILLPCLLSCHRCEKSARENHAISPVDYGTWQHPHENPRYVRGSAPIYDVRMVQFVTNIKIVSLHTCARIPKLRVSVPDSGSWSGMVIKYKRICVLQVRNYKLVSDDGIIRPEIFYKALTTWTNEDFLGYQFSQVCYKSIVF